MAMGHGIGTGLYSTGYVVVAFDYIGFGASEGSLKTFSM